MIAVKFSHFSLLYSIILTYSVYSENLTTFTESPTSSVRTPTETFRTKAIERTTNIPINIETSNTLKTNTYQSTETKPSTRIESTQISTMVTEQVKTESPRPTTTYPTFKMSTVYPYSGPITNLSVTSSFPFAALNITWTPPVDANGEIVQYFIWVQNTNNECVLTMSLNCTNCKNNISASSSPDNSTNNCYGINGSTFGSNNKAFSVIISDGKITPYTNYTINVRALNGFGWGIPTNVYSRTSQYISGQVTNLTVALSYPQRIQVTWEPPVVANGEIIQYFIWMQNANNECVLAMSVNCTGCTNNIQPWPDNITRTCLINRSAVFYKQNTTISVTISEDQIQICTNITLNVVPLNGYGIGKVSKAYAFLSSNDSEPVSNLSFKISFPLEPLRISWQPPENKTSEIIQYFIWIQKLDTDQCVLAITMNCTNCQKNISQLFPTDINIAGCYSIPGPKFNSTDPNFSLLITDLAIRPKTNYAVNVRPLIMCGWGPISKYFVTTPSYSPSPVTNLISTSDNMQITICWTAPVVHTVNYRYNILVIDRTYTFKQSLNMSSCFTTNPLESCTYYTLSVTVIDDYNITSSTTSVSNLTGLSTVTINNISSSITGNSISLVWTYENQSNCLVQFNVDNNISVNTNVTTNKFQMHNLKYFTRYLITVTPYSFMSDPKLSSKGKSLNHAVTTGEGIPSSVLSFKCVNQSYTVIVCSWIPPSEKNGIILNYWLTCYNDSVIYNAILSLTNATISDTFETDKVYTCQVNASTSVGYGKPIFTSLLIISSAFPDVNNVDKMPQIMENSNLAVSDEYTQVAITLPYSHFTNNSGTIRNFTLVVSESKINIVNGSITSLEYQNGAYSEYTAKKIYTYEIHLPYPKRSKIQKRSTNSISNWQNADFIVGNNASNSPFDHDSNGPLKSGTSYVIGIRAYTNNGFITPCVIKKKTAVNKIATIVGVSVAVFVVICLSVVIYFSIRYKRNKQQPTPINTTITRLLPLDNKSPAVHEFHENYEFMRQDCNGRLIDDFREIKELAVALERQKVIVFVEGNEAKNRFSNIKPYKHNRVKLLAKNDYINASKICAIHWQSETEDDCFCSNIYIATQGPIGENREPKIQTIGDFWRMILENNVSVIVNLTRVEEHGKEKCSQYWPTEVNQKTRYYSEDDPIDVEMTNSIDYTTYAERVFNVSMEEKEMSVTQLHMVAWKDHSCPTTSEFLTFYLAYKKVRQSNQPIVVHCSAGVGRTGTFILIDEELSRIMKENDKIEIYNNLLNLRKCRCQMVQTESQYCFIYSVIHEYLVQSGLIKIPRDNRDDTNLFRQSYENPIFVE